MPKVTDPISRATCLPPLTAYASEESLAQYAKSCMEIASRSAYGGPEWKFIPAAFLQPPPDHLWSSSCELLMDRGAFFRCLDQSRVGFVKAGVRRRTRMTGVAFFAHSALPCDRALRDFFDNWSLAIDALLAREPPFRALRCYADHLNADIQHNPAFETYSVSATVLIWPHNDPLGRGYGLHIGSVQLFALGKQRATALTFNDEASAFGQTSNPRVRHDPYLFMVERGTPLLILNRVPPYIHPNSFANACRLWKQLPSDQRPNFAAMVVNLCLCYPGLSVYFTENRPIESAALKN